jgi:hypothetical protein
MGVTCPRSVVRLASYGLFLGANMQRLTDEELAELERLEKAATPGFWNRRDIGDSIIECEDDTLLCTFPSEQGNEDSNAKFVALSRNALPLLLAEVRELRAAALRGIIAWKEGKE